LISRQEKELAGKDQKIERKNLQLLETAKLLKQLNVNIAIIVEKTGLSRDEIEKV